MERSTVREFHIDLNKAIAEVTKKYGFTGSIRSVSWNDEEISGRVKIFVSSAAKQSVATSADKMYDSRWSRVWGFKSGDRIKIWTGEEMICKSFTSRGSCKAKSLVNGKVYRLSQRSAERVTLVGKDGKVKSVPKTGLTPAIKNEFIELATRLSPENLACDGEISRTETNKRYRQCLREWKALEVKAGVKVTESEVWGWDEIDLPPAPALRVNGAEPVALV